MQPYGLYWRLGANESTEIVFSRDVLFNNEPVKAGTYKMYAIPGVDQFEIVLNSALGTWGYNEPDHSLDLLKNYPSGTASSFTGRSTHLQCLAGRQWC